MAKLQFVLLVIAILAVQFAQPKANEEKSIRKILKEKIVGPIKKAVYSSFQGKKEISGNEKDSESHRSSITESIPWDDDSTVADSYENRDSSSFEPSMKQSVHLPERVEFECHSSYPKSTKIGHRSYVGYECFLDKGITLGEGVRVGNGVNIYQRSTIEASSFVHDHVSIGCNVTLETEVEIGPNSVICGNLDVASGAYIGANVLIKRSVPYRATIHDFVELLPSVLVECNDVMIPYLSSLDFYTKCNGSTVIGMENSNIDEKDPLIATDDFDELLSNLIKSQFSRLREICLSRDTPIVLDYLTEITNLYLIRYHGAVKFQENQSLMNASRLTVKLSKLLSEEYHFTNASRIVLGSEVSEIFIRLWAIELNIERTYRIHKDNGIAFNIDRQCSMIRGIDDKIRKVKYLKRVKNIESSKRCLYGIQYTKNVLQQRVSRFIHSIGEERKN